MDIYKVITNAGTYVFVVTDSFAKAERIGSKKLLKYASWRLDRIELVGEVSN